ncbi:Mitochondrial-processing peptidase subunit alpha, partial [Actinomortierella ambigua]
MSKQLTSVLARNVLPLSRSLARKAPWAQPMVSRMSKHQQATAQSESVQTPGRIIAKSPSPATSGTRGAETKVTTLPNGVRVATENSGGHFASLGVYVDAGSRYEDNATRGVSHILDRLAFK